MGDGTNLGLNERLAYAVSLVPVDQFPNRIARSAKQIKRYLAGADIPFSVLTMVSMASGVPIDWLASGRSTFPSWEEVQEWKNMAHPSENIRGYEYFASDEADFHVRLPNSEPKSSANTPAKMTESAADDEAPPPRGLFSVVDVDRFAAALEGANDLFRRLNRRPDTVRLTQVALLIYDAVGEEQPSQEAILAAMEGRD